MPVLGVGTDLVEVERIRDMLARHGERFVAKTFTQGEIDYCDGSKDRAMHYAARFAAKEAVAKALGSGLWAEGVDWKDIEVIRAESGAPSIALHRGAKAKLASLGGSEALVSLSHTRDLATATALIQ